ncbi:hypothetical protein KFE25_013242 [Diacronema lutheri]|uniref:NIPSNAP domain-containing protein n=1 Tax=Diacronema lutheri TaxID=2081491 RepID=A0A8J5X0L7_DIALT|nr:hypothetical protein KFE25_013242 [Diacronema lutheri]
MASKLVAGKGFIEVRRAVLRPERRAAYLMAHANAAPLLSRARPGLLASLVAELGADANEVISLHAHASYDERDAREAAARADAEFGAALGELSTGALHAERSEAFVEALECVAAAGADARGAAAFAPRADRRGAVYEWREYQLVLGYNPIPKLREAFVAGLPSKVAVDVEQRAELAFMGWTDVGGLNRFVELWRYASIQEAMRAREAARASAEWRGTIGTVAPMVQSFSTAFYRPAVHSPWQ